MGVKVPYAICKKSGHVQEQCRKAWAEGQAALRAERERAQEAFEDRRAEAAMRRETAQEAFEDRQRRRIERAEAAMRRSEWLRSHPCWHCGQQGHVRDECPMRLMQLERNMDASSDISSVPSAASSEKPSSAQSESTVATRAEIVKVVVAPLPDNCSFCGAKRIEPKRKGSVNACRNRCHACWREYNK